MNIKIVSGVALFFASLLGFNAFLLNENDGKKTRIAMVEAEVEQKENTIEFLLKENERLTEEKIALEEAVEEQRSIRLSAHQQVFSKNIGLLIEKADELGIGLTFGEAWRTIYQQREYVRQGKSLTLNSNHLQRLAVDFNFFIDGELTYDWATIKPLGDYWESLDPNNRWGGDWNNDGVKNGWLDIPHFEMFVQ